MGGRRQWKTGTRLPDAQSLQQENSRILQGQESTVRLPASVLLPEAPSPEKQITSSAGRNLAASWQRQRNSA